MSIRFKCRLCKKALAVKDHVAGKKVICPGCHKPIMVPKPKPVPADVEDLAASMLGDDEPKKEAKPKAAEAAPIKFMCDFCAEDVTVPASEAGSKMPCPECKRIISVPVLKVEKAKDWRDTSRKGPIGAKDNQVEQIDNAWGTEQTRGASRTALEEADAIPQKAEPIKLSLWLKRGFITTMAVGFAYLAYTGMVKSRSTVRETEAVKEALILAEKLPPEWAAEVHRAAGEIYCTNGKPIQADQEFKKAFASLRNQKPTFEIDLFLIDLALSQIEMGGSDDDIMEKKRVAWSAVQRDVSQTLELVSADARGLSLRIVGARLAEKKQLALAIGIAGSSPVQQVGLNVAYKAALEKAVNDPDNAVRQNATRELAAKFKKDEDKDKLPYPKGDDAIDPDARLAHVEGLARQGKEKYQEALELANRSTGKTEQEKIEEALQRLEACVSGAELALANRNPDAAALFLAKALEANLDLQGKQAVPKWLLFRTVRAGTLADVADTAELAKTLDPAYLPYVKLLAFRQKLTKASSTLANVEGIGAEKEQRELLCWPLAWEALARHNARLRSNLQEIVALGRFAEDDRVKAFLLVGFALGQHETSKTSP